MKKILFLIFIFVQINLYAGIVDTVLIPSQAMQTEFKSVVVVPDKYADSDKKSWPVVYLLHGWSGKYSDWIRKADLSKLSDEYNFIIVCPDGGYAGWYLDSPLLKESQYETYIAKEVIKFIDISYRTKADFLNRFICGLSMGGQGALRLIAKYPDLFDAAGSMSGVMDLSEASQKFGITQLLGEYEITKDLWQRESCLKIIESLAGKNKGIIIDCGIKDRFIESNKKIHHKMMELNIQHDYYERPGGHSWDYWVNALEYHLLFFKKRILKQN